MTLPEMMQARPILRGSLIAPSVVVVIFIFFNLTAIVDQSTAVQRLKIGVVNLDEGAPGTGTEPLRISDRALAAMARQSPLGTTKFADETSATAALENGEVVAVLLFPADFSRTIAAGGTAQVRVLNSDHLSVLETQIGRTLPVQLQAGLALAAVGARAQLEQGASPRTETPSVTGAPMEAPPPPAAPMPAQPPAVAGPQGPPVLVTATALHPVSNPALLQAPFVMSFASWMASLVGAFLLFLGTRPLLGLGNVGPVAVARTIIPVVAAIVAAFLSVVIVGALTGAWAHFFQLWAFRWLATAAAMAIITGLFSLLGVVAFVVAVPLVFYQTLVAGVLAPPSAAPSWIAWLGRLPFYESTVGLRTLLIGGPAGSGPWVGVAAMLCGGIVATWIGTFIWGRRAVPSAAPTS